jgi:hypothetical protein
MNSTTLPQLLRRYTDIPSLLYLLHSKSITLLDPASWDDTNDSYFLLKYKEKKNLQSVLALCLTQTDETYHHWRVFAGNASGVCILFDKQALLNTLSKVGGIVKGSVNYQRVRDMRRRGAQLSVDDLPFMKRAGFTPEAEFRVLYTSAMEHKRFLDIPIPLTSIVEIRLSPWLNGRVRKCIKDTIRSIPGCAHLEIHRSTLIGNSTWKKFGDRAT